MLVELPSVEIMCTAPSSPIVMLPRWVREVPPPRLRPNLFALSVALPSDPASILVPRW